LAWALQVQKDKFIAGYMGYTPYRESLDKWVSFELGEDVVTVLCLVGAGQMHLRLPVW
jgi:hypothetical protein